MPPDLQRGAQSAADLHLEEVLERLWRARLVLAGSTAIFAALFAVIALVATPDYRAEAVLVPAEINNTTLIDPSADPLSSLTSMLGLNYDPLEDQHTEEALAVLRSREFTEDFVRSQNLLPVLYASYWDATRQSWRPRFGGPPTLAEGSRRFRNLCTIWRDQLTGLINFQLDWRDPVQAAAWINAMVSRLNAEMRARAISDADAGLAFLKRELAGTAEVEERDAIGILMELQLDKRMVADVSEQYAFRVVDRALTPDPLDPQWPHKGLLVVVGGLTGLFWGAIIVFAGPTIRSRFRK